MAATVPVVTLNVITMSKNLSVNFGILARKKILLNKETIITLNMWVTFMIILIIDIDFSLL